MVVCHAKPNVFLSRQAFNLVGLVILTVICQAHGWLVSENLERVRFLEAAVHPLIKTNEAGKG
jgi:hypothetical protein